MDSHVGFQPQFLEDTEQALGFLLVRAREIPLDELDIGPGTEETPGDQPEESMKCSTKLFGSVTASELKVGGMKSFKPSKLRPCNSSVRLRSSATSKLGCAPKDAKTPPVRGFIR